MVGRVEWVEMEWVSIMSRLTDFLVAEMPECDLQCTPKMEGFDVQFNCFYSQTFYYYVSSACSGQDFFQTTGAIPFNSIAGDVLDISDASILGNRL